MQLEFEDGVNLNIGKGEAGGAARAFNFRSAQDAVLAAIELDTCDFARLAVFGDGEILLAAILEQVFPGVGAAPPPPDEARRPLAGGVGELDAGEEGGAGAG